MKVYRVQYQNYDKWVCVWFANKAEAKKFIKELTGTGYVPLLEPESRVIPTDKKGLVQWLNWHGGNRP